MEDVSVAATFLLAIVGFIILANVCAPLNGYSIKVIGGSIVVMILGAIFFHDLFSISYVSVECVMLFALFAIATEPFMRYLTMIFTSVESRMQKIFNQNKAKI